MSRVVAVANQKGGVGKTTTALNLAASLAAAGRRVLLVDMDPQGNLTSGVNLKGQSTPVGTVYNALTQTEPLTDARPFILATKSPRLEIIPADRSLTGAEIEMVSLDRREERLRLLLGSVRHQYDYTFIDSPPSLGLLTLNALVAADAVLIPLHCEYYALEGLADLWGTIRRVRSALNPSLDIEGVLFTMFDERTNLGQQVAGEVRAFFKEKVFRTTIPRNVRLGEAPSHGLPVIEYDPKSRGSEAYVALAKEVLERASAATSAI
jgi:chromosome partitioning protein